MLIKLLLALALVTAALLMAVSKRGLWSRLLDEIAALTNYVTARFGAKSSSLTAEDIVELRNQLPN